MLTSSPFGGGVIFFCPNQPYSMSNRTISYQLICAKRKLSKKTLTKTRSFSGKKRKGILISQSKIFHIRILRFSKLKNAWGLLLASPVTVYMKGKFFLSRTLTIE